MFLLWKQSYTEWQGRANSRSAGSSPATWWWPPAEAGDGHVRQQELQLPLPARQPRGRHDGGFQLTLKVYRDEGINIPRAIAKEALEGERAVTNYLLKGKKAG